MKLIFLIAILGVILNPRIVFNAKEATHVISCSTGWSFYWEGFLREKGLLGIYSPESVAWAKVSNQGQFKKAISNQKALVQKEFIKVCR